MRKTPKNGMLIGIDEVGRGPLAGPVAVVALFATPSMVAKFRNIKESKQLSPRDREEWFKKIMSARGSELDFAVSFVGATTIDRKGIQYAIALALKRSLEKLGKQPHLVRVLLDGGLHAPRQYWNQQTIIGGDGKETVIAMASVVAKVLRDRRMVRMEKKFPGYGFAVHKGYGTALHVKKIKKHGLSTQHRKSFCKNFCT